MKKSLVTFMMLGVMAAASSQAYADECTIYYDNGSTNWSQVNIHYWNAPKTEWPGVAMTLVEGNVWSYTFDADPSPLTGFLFCNGTGGDQTADYTSQPADGHIYTGTSGKGAVKDLGLYSEYDPTPGPTPTPGPVPTPGESPVPAGSLNTAYYQVNPNGQLGTFRTVNMNFNNQNSTTALSNWTPADLIAQGVARDVAQAMKGYHERPIVDSYALYASYDNDYLYLGAQFVYTVWDAYGEGKQPGESKPYNMDGCLCWAFDLAPDSYFDGYIDGRGPIWNDQNLGAKFNNGVDAIWVGSTKPGVGVPGFFTPTPEGHASYDAAYCKSISGTYYGYADGLLPSITEIWGQSKFGYDPAALEGEEGFADLMGEIDPSAHTFYEWRFPLSVLGITADYIKNNGIGVMFIDKYGTSPVGGTPYDPSYFDNVKESYSMDPSSSKEKEDEDIITYAPARIGKLASPAGVEAVTDARSTEFAVNFAAGTLTVINTEGAQVIVSGIDGKVYTSVAAAPERVSVNLNAGIYIVSVNGQTRKVAVK